MVDQINKNNRKQQSEFEIIQNEVKYQGLLQLIDERIKITLTQGFSQFKWCGTYSIEQLIKISKIFMVCDSIEISFEYFKEIIRSNALEVKKDGQKIILIFTYTHLNLNVAFDIQLMQEQISTNDAMRDLSNQVLEMQKEIDELKISQKSQDEVINSYKNEIEELKIYKSKNEQKMEQQEKTITCYKNEIEELKNSIKKLQVDNLQQISEIQKYLLPRFAQPKYSEVLCKKDVDKIGQWIHEGKKKMELKLVYRATIDEFQTSKFYEKCSNITPTIVIVETNQSNKRFGGYTDLLWKNYDGYCPLNTNQSFLFSLDLDQKYTLNDPNCQHAIYGNSNYIAFGCGHDLTLNNNSNTTENQGDFQSYGKNEGASNYDLIGGVNSFTTREIEVFQVILN